MDTSINSKNKKNNPPKPKQMQLCALKVQKAVYIVFADMAQ